MIPRDASHALTSLAAGYPVLAVTGPRQSGKTTLCRALFPALPYASLEDPDTRQFAQEDTRGFLAQYPDGAVLDEAQRCPDLFAYLQRHVDEDPRPGRFVLTGSQQFGLMSGISQSQAGGKSIVLVPRRSLDDMRRRLRGRGTTHVHERQDRL